jgi:hypothetical protein
MLGGLGTDRCWLLSLLFLSRLFILFAYQPRCKKITETELLLQNLQVVPLLMLFSLLFFVEETERK